MEHIDTILALILALKTAATIIVNLTPTPKDDEIVAKAYRVIEVIAGLWTGKAKQ